MRASTLRFDHGRVYISTGIKLVRPMQAAFLTLFAHPQRTIVLPYFAERPPFFEEVDHGGERASTSLMSLSLIQLRNGKVYACEQVDTFESVLLLIDTYDDRGVVCDGGYIPLREQEYPFQRSVVAEAKGSAPYGLVLFAPGDSCVIRTSANFIGKISLSSRGVFSSVATSDAEERLFDEISGS